VVFHPITQESVDCDLPRMLLWSRHPFPAQLRSPAKQIADRWVIECMQHVTPVQRIRLVRQLQAHIDGICLFGQNDLIILPVELPR
jgi:hypothetical protein